eukprot:2309690-Rhodomonas_salina.3
MAAVSKPDRNHHLLHRAPQPLALAVCHGCVGPYMLNTTTLRRVSTARRCPVLTRSRVLPLSA